MTVKFTNIPMEILIDSLPENTPLYKDSGLWQIRSDDMEDVICHQVVNESFKEFICRYISDTLNSEDRRATVLNIKLAIL